MQNDTSVFSFLHFFSFPFQHLERQENTRVCRTGTARKFPLLSILACTAFHPAHLSATFPPLLMHTSQPWAIREKAFLFVFPRALRTRCAGGFWFRVFVVPRPPPILRHVASLGLLSRRLSTPTATTTTTKTATTTETETIMGSARAIMSVGSRLPISSQHRASPARPLLLFVGFLRYVHPPYHGRLTRLSTHALNHSKKKSHRFL